MSKYQINKGNWIWNDSIPIDKLLDLTDLDTLNKRGKYLTEVIDTLPNTLDYHYIESLPQGNNIIALTPGAGKTTAMRQWISHHYDDYPLVSLRKIDDIKKFYYDLKAIQYLGYIPPNCKITAYYSGSNVDKTSLVNSNILIVTHERLLIEPPNLIYWKPTNLSQALMDLTLRPVLIDEFPKYQRKYYISSSIRTSIALLSLESRGSKYTLLQSIESSLLVYYKNPEELLRSTRDALEVILKELRLPLSIDDTSKINQVIQKFLFYIGLVTPYYEQDDQVYYGLTSIPLSQINVFDGTGDIMFKDSTKWKVITNSEFSRKLKLNHDIIQLPKNLQYQRTIKSIKDSEFIIKQSKKILHLIKLILKNPDNKLLVYTWKDLKLSTKENNKTITNSPNDLISLSITKVISNFTEYLYNQLTTEEKSRCTFIHYQSGLERTTSDYIDYNQILILGKFNIPNSEISVFNEVNQCTTNSDEYTLSLIIQLLYRTKSRIGEPISLYLSSDYDNNFIKNLKNCFNTIDNLNYTIDKDILNYLFSETLSYTSRDYNYYKLISDNMEKLLKESEIEFIVPEGIKSSDYKSSISNFVNKYSFLEYQNIPNTNKFIIKLIERLEYS